MERKKLIILNKGKYSDNVNFAKNMIRFKSTNWIIINRNNIRSIINNNYCMKKELFVEDIEMYLIKNSLLRGFDVIVILVNKTEKEYNKILNIKKEYEHLFYLDIEFKDITIKDKKDITIKDKKDNILTKILKKLRKIK